MKTINYKILIGLFLLIIFSERVELKAQQTANDSLIKLAEKEYIDGNYKQAVACYEKIVKSGYSAPELYYNLANAYYKESDYKSAILNYERALLLDPNNEDITTNLEFAKAHNRDKIDEIPNLFFVRWFHTFTQLLPSRTWAVYSIVSFILFLIFTLGFLFLRIISLRKLSFYLSILLFFVSAISYYNSYKQYNRIMAHDYAIVFTPSVTVKSAPGVNGTDLFIIHEGLKVKVLDRTGEWTEIRLSDGKIGWLPDNSVVAL